MSTKKPPRNAARKQKPTTATRVKGSMNLCEVAERLEVAKKELRARLRRSKRRKGSPAEMLWEGRIGRSWRQS